MGGQDAEGRGEAAKVISEVNSKYLELHQAFESHFWSTKMNLEGNDRDALAKSKKELDLFLASPEVLAKVQAAAAALPPPGEKRKREEDEYATVLRIMEKTFKSYALGEPATQAVKDEATDKEQVLLAARKDMSLGWTHPVSGEFEEASSVQLRTTMRVNADEAVRKACYEGLRSIGPVVAGQLGEIVRLRNKLARSQGFSDFYDYNVTNVEGFSKAVLFEKLDKLEQATREQLVKARDALKAEKADAGFDALAPWNVSFALSGSIEQEMSPYFPFETAVETWGRSFAALGIKYRGSTLNLDLLDRKGKYSNGFCHWPVPAFRKCDGAWVPSVANFTSLASPQSVGSGKTALRTLLHEGGHAAHFANVDPLTTCGSPLFSQERAPTSVAYAENQSMFLDKLVGEGDWLAKYAKDASGKPIPFELIERQIRATHPYSVFTVRDMLKVPYFEKALYELSDEELTAENIIALADKVELEIVGGASSLPLLAVPHILSGESCCYYHGYVLADMSVYQTRKHFFDKYGYITDNPKVGPDLLEFYWKPGNSRAFLDLVKGLTGSELTADAWLEDIAVPTDEVVAETKAKYDKALAASAEAEGASVDLDMTLRVVHGDEVIADSAEDGGFSAACDKFKAYVRTNFPAEE